MRIFRNITIALISFLATSAIVISASAQSTSSLSLALDQKSFEVSSDDTARVNLLKEIQKVSPAALSSPQFEIQMLRLRVRTGIGGAQFFLRVNNQYMDSESVETDPDQLNAPLGSGENAARVELKNIDRARITEASLIVQGYSNARIYSVEVVMGAVTEIAIIGHYADDQVRLVGGDESETDGQIVKPSPQAMTDIYNRYYAPADSSPTPDSSAVAISSAANPVIAHQLAETLRNSAATGRDSQTTTVIPAATVTIPPTTGPTTSVSTRRPVTTTTIQQYAERQRVVPSNPATAPVPARKCATNRRGSRICVGDRVHNRWGFSGVVSDLQTQSGQSMVLVQFSFGDNKWRDIDSVNP